MTDMDHAAGSPASQRIAKRVHPPIVRLTHWGTAIAILILIGSGWRIYNNDTIFSAIEFPVPLTLGGDWETTYRLRADTGFGNATLWHFAAMWLLLGSFLVYALYGVISGRFYRMLFPLSPRSVLKDFFASVTFSLKHEVGVYNAVQKLLYIVVILAVVVMLFSGLAIWKPVQFQEITWLMGGFQGARLVHFLGMSVITLFLVVHVALAFLVPTTLWAMITGTQHGHAQTPATDAQAAE